MKMKMRKREPMTKPQLVLDIGGVLATNLSPFFWNQLGEAGQISTERLYAAYKQQWSSLLWKGEISEKEFWDWLLIELPGVSYDKARAMLDNSLTPLPALEMIADWSGYADIHILSNHRAEWVRPLLSPIMPYLATVTISSEVGSSKPEMVSFTAVHRKLPVGSSVLFVDDQPKNLLTAEQLGWDTLLADEAGEWIPQVELLLLG